MKRFEIQHSIFTSCSNWICGIQKNSPLQDPDKSMVYFMLHDFTDTTSLADTPITSSDRVMSSSFKIGITTASLQANGR
jgi:hypothetical protein